MNRETQLWLERKKYREYNNITGKYIRLNFITNNRINPITERKDDDTYENLSKRIEFITNKIRPVGLCFYTTKKYHILCNDIVNSSYY